MDSVIVFTYSPTFICNHKINNCSVFVVICGLSQSSKNLFEQAYWNKVMSPSVSALIL